VPSPAKCICPGNKVPFYCPVHGRVENPNWPGLNVRRSVELLQEQQVKPPSLDPPPPPNDNSIVAVNDNNGDERQGAAAHQRREGAQGWC
jgi:hypothetical protein